MSDRDLRNLYESVRRGDEYVAPQREGELYKDVYTKLNEDVSLYTKAKRGYEHIGDVTEQDFAKITRLATNGEAIKLIQSYLIQKQYTTDSFKGEDDYRILIELLDATEFEKYIEQKKPELRSTRAGNIFEIMAQAGLNTSMIQRISRYTPVDKNGSNLGPGEILLALTFDDVRNSTIGGDLMIGNEKLEVKGQGGRFGQQGGRGGVSFSVDPLFTAIGVEQPQLYRRSVIGTEPKPEVNLEVWIRTAYNMYESTGKKASFIKNLQSLLKSAYPNGNIANFINDSIDFNAVGTRKQRSPIRLALSKLNYDHYSTSHKTNLFLFINKTRLDFAMFEKEEALKQGGLIDAGILKCDAFTVNELFPNWSYVF